MTRRKQPTEKDRQKLEMLHRKIAEDDLHITCGCGEDEACSDCGIEITADDVYVFLHDADKLELRVRLVNLDPRSKLAQRYNYSVTSGDSTFADTVDWISENMDDHADLESVGEAVRLITAADTYHIEEGDPIPISKPLGQI